MSAKPNTMPAGRASATNARTPFIRCARSRSADPAVTIDRRDDGTIYLRPKIALGDYPVRITDRLHHWASAEPNRIFMAERDGGGWRKITYAQLLASSPAHRLGACWRAICRPKSRSSFSPAIPSITR